MATSYSPKIVTDGLIMLLDAANPRSYTSGSSVWNDVTNNGNSGSIISPILTASNAISFLGSGIDGYVLLKPYIATAQNITVSTWFKKTNTTDTEHILYEGTNGDGFGTEQEFHLSVSTQAPSVLTANTVGIWGTGTGGTGTLNLYGTLSSSAVYHNVTFTLGNMTTPNTTVTASLYINGEFVTSSQTILSRSLYTEPMRLGRSTSTIRQFNGSISSVGVYNRVLSSQEVLQNFNATRGRFGV